MRTATYMFIYFRTISSILKRIYTIIVNEISCIIILQESTSHISTILISPLQDVRILTYPVISIITILYEFLLFTIIGIGDTFTMFTIVNPWIIIIICLNRFISKNP
ncbi:Uncharacterised protein [Segatella copri]|nr:Uncharacterised protein [Segatella copri]